MKKLPTIYLNLIKTLDNYVLNDAAENAENLAKNEIKFITIWLTLIGTHLPNNSRSVDHY